MRVIGSISAENFECHVREDDDGRVWFEADADIDADGANGQNQQVAAYVDDNSGSEHLANGGMAIRDGKVICAHDWARDIVVLGPDGEPKIFSNGLIVSKTWYRYSGIPEGAKAYVDAQTVPYICVPPLIIEGVTGVVRGCRARVTWKGKSIYCVVADRGPRSRIGELSIAAADALRMPSNPRTGGVISQSVLYELWPGVAASGFELQPA